MATKVNQTSEFADFLQKSESITFETNADSGAISCDLVGAASLTDAANGEFDVDLSGMGEVAKVLELSVLSADGTTTATSAIDASGNLTLSVNSDQDLSSGSDDIIIRCVLVRAL